MKHTKRLTALILALCLLALMPLTAAAGSEYDTLVTGSWEIFAMYDSASQQTQLMNPSASTLKLNGDGTGSLFLVDTTYDVKWSYASTAEAGHIFAFDFTWQGSEMNAYMIYSASGAMEGMLSIAIGSNGMLIYSRAA